MRLKSAGGVDTAATSSDVDGRGSPSQVARTEVWLLDGDAKRTALLSAGLDALGYCSRVFAMGGDLAAGTAVNLSTVVVIDWDFETPGGVSTLCASFAALPTDRRPHLMVRGEGHTDCNVAEVLAWGADEVVGVDCTPVDLVARIRAAERRVRDLQVLATQVQELATGSESNLGVGARHSAVQCRQVCSETRLPGVGIAEEAVVVAMSEAGLEVQRIEALVDGEEIAGGLCAWSALVALRPGYWLDLRVDAVAGAAREIACSVFQQTEAADDLLEDALAELLNLTQGEFKRRMLDAGVQVLGGIIPQFGSAKRSPLDDDLQFEIELREQRLLLSICEHLAEPQDRDLAQLAPGTMFVDTHQHPPATVPRPIKPGAILTPRSMTALAAWPPMRAHSARVRVMEASAAFRQLSQDSSGS